MVGDILVALIISDPKINARAEEPRQLTGAKTKTEAVRRALQTQLAEARRVVPLRDRLARSKALADALGPSDPDFDMKVYADDMSGET